MLWGQWTHFWKTLGEFQSCQKGAVEVMRAMQRTVLCSAARILRRHLSVEGLGHGR